MVELICCGCIAAIAAVDQLIKIAVLNSSLVSGEVVTVIDGFLQWRYVENTGAAFSLFTGKTVLLSVFTAVVLLVGFYLTLRAARFASQSARSSSDAKSFESFGLPRTCSSTTEPQLVAALCALPGSPALTL